MATTERHMQDVTFAVTHHDTLNRIFTSGTIVSHAVAVMRDMPALAQGQAVMWHSPSLGMWATARIDAEGYMHDAQYAHDEDTAVAEYSLAAREVHVLADENGVELWWTWNAGDPVLL